MLAVGFFLVLFILWVDSGNGRIESGCEVDGALGRRVANAELT